MVKKTWVEKGSSQADPLLRTKLYIPTPRPDSLARPDLVARLNAGSQQALTVISAPAGFGKSTLLSEWVHQSKMSVAWLSLDETDNDPAQFLAYFIAAIRTVQPDFAEATLTKLQIGQVPLLSDLLPPLLAELNTHSERFGLVLDDYHLIKAQPIHSAFAFLFSHMPPSFHLVITSRTDPPLPLSRLRVQGQLTELRTADLRFSHTEIVDFFRRAPIPRLKEQQIVTLEEKTEGWPAGLQLAALSIAGRDADQIDQFVTTFSGDHHFILDYLADEVLTQRPEGTRGFLLQTSILKRLSAPLCAAVTGQNDSHTILKTLDRANLFLIPLDDQRRWYRYHQLFADFLRQRLEHELDQAEIQALYQRASAWHEADGSSNEAINYAISAQDWSRAASLIEHVSLSMWFQAQFRTLGRWLGSFPKLVRQVSPRISVLYAFSLVITGRYGQAEASLQLAETAYQTENNRAMLGEIFRIRALAAYLQGDSDHLLIYAQQALDYLPETDLAKRTMATTFLGIGYILKGQLPQAQPYLQQAVPLSQATGVKRLMLIARSHLANLAHHCGELRRAVAAVEAIIQEIGDDPNLLIKMGCYAGLSSVYYEWNNLPQAADYIQQGFKLMQLSGRNQWGVTLYQNMSRIYWVQGQDAQARQMLDEALKIAQGFDSDRHIKRLKAYQARLHLANGNLVAARRWGHEAGLKLADKPIYEHQFEYLTLVRLCLAEGQSRLNPLEDVWPLLDHYLASAEETGRIPDVIEINILKALLAQALDQPEPALSSLAQALALAEPDSYIRSFVDEGPPMAALLRQAALRGVALSYVEKLIAAFMTDDRASSNSRLSSPTTSPLVEPLSRRELEVLRLIAVGLTNNQIAEELHLASTTIKKHVTNINSKLNATNRTQSVARARELDLLQ